MFFKTIMILFQLILHIHLMEVINLENSYRNNIVELASIHLGKNYVWNGFGPDDFDNAGLTTYIFKELFGVDILKNGYGLDNTTKQMTNSIGTLRKYRENDSNKTKYLEDIKVGDLVFFHTQALEDNQPTPNNRYPGHVGIYIGDKKFIHASLEEEKIIISLLEETWLKKLVASRDIVSGII